MITFAVSWYDRKHNNLNGAHWFAAMIADAVWLSAFAEAIVALVTA